VAVVSGAVFFVEFLRTFVILLVVGRFGEHDGGNVFLSLSVPLSFFSLSLSACEDTLLVFFIVVGVCRLRDLTRVKDVFFFS